MTTRDRTSQIIEVKGRNSRHSGSPSCNLERLRDQWRDVAQSQSRLPDFYIIRAVTILEVATRQEISALIDHAKPFTDRAVELSKQIKMDFATVRAGQGRAVTLGDIVAHSIPVNSFGQILGYFETLLGKPFRPLLIGTIDRWSVEIMKQPPQPIILNFDALASRLTRLFEIRHILCHELPKESVYKISEVDDFLDDAVQFTKATENVLQFEKYGLTPLTQTEMNIDAMAGLKEIEEELSRLIDRATADLSDSGEELACLEDTHEKWLAYRNAQCDLQTWLYRGGTIRTLLWATDALTMTGERITTLTLWLDEQSKP